MPSQWRPAPRCMATRVQVVRTAALPRPRSAHAVHPAGDARAEARRHKMGTGLTAATTTFMGDSYTFIDCPGWIEFAHDMRAAIPAVDAAIVVEPARIVGEEAQGMRALYVALTRATKRLRVVHAEPLPDGLRE